MRSRGAIAFVALAVSLPARPVEQIFNRIRPQPLPRLAHPAFGKQIIGRQALRADVEPTSNFGNLLIAEQRHARYQP